MRSAPPTAAIAQPAADAAEVARLTRERLKELDRLRDFGFMQIERFNKAADTVPTAVLLDRMLGAKGQVMEFERLARTMRQIMVLEFELRGLFQAPDRDAPRKLRLVKSDRPGFEPPDLEKFRLDLEPLEDLLDIRSDYRTGPLDQVVAGIRQTLGAAPPENDPFAPPPERAAKLPPATVKLPEKLPQPDTLADQRKLAVKAAALAIRANGGAGFRKPSKKQIAKRRPNGRGPPR
ncbi:MAG TPA: hypothetical protein VH722_13110 [Alphaproteobacteria bacterium]|nr:hypothetical protein [Alphaproteobacteria bacterium]